MRDGLGVCGFDNGWWVRGRCRWLDVEGWTWGGYIGGWQLVDVDGWMSGGCRWMY